MDFKPFILLLIFAGLSYGIPVSHTKSNASPKTKKSLSDPDPCCVPTSHGNVSMLIATDSQATFSSMATVAFDNENYKAAAHGIVPDPTNPSSTISIIVDWTGGLMYIALPQVKQCSTAQLPVGAMGTCIPDDDYQYLGRGNLGWDAAASTPVDMWQIDGSEAGLDMQFTAWTTPKQCGMVKMGLWGSTQQGNDQISASLSFYNMTMGVKDPSVFTVPSYCSGANKRQGALVLSPLQAMKFSFHAMGRKQNDRL